MLKNILSQLDSLHCVIAPAKERELFKSIIFYIESNNLLLYSQHAIVMKHFVVFDVCKSVHHYTIQINQPTRYDSFTSLLLDVHM